MKVKIISFNTFYDDDEYIEDSINSYLEDKEVVDVKQSLIEGKSYDQTFLYFVILYK